MARKKSRTKQKRVKALTEEAQRILLKISKESKERPVALVAGAFGDMEGCAGIIEGDLITPPDGGTFVKFYGCSYLFKGYPLKQIVEGLGLGKSLISAIPREIISKSFLISLALVLLSLFSRKRFIHYCRVYASMLWNHTVGKAGIPHERYNKQAREIRRVTHLLVQMELLRLKKEFDNKGFPLTHYNLHMTSERELCELITCVGEFVALFIEYDNAYRFRLGDVLPLLNKQAVRDNVRKEVGRIIDILISREHPTQGIGWKWRDMKRIIMLFLFISPFLREWTKRFLLELNLDEVALDEHDKYFCLQRRGYRFGGIPLAKRLKEKKRIDKVKGHIKIDIKDVVRPDGKVDYVVSIKPTWQNVKRERRQIKDSGHIPPNITQVPTEFQNLI